MRYFRVLTISLIFHLILAILLSLVPTPPVRLDMRQVPFVELLEKPELPKRPHQRSKEERQFVRSVQVPSEVVTEEKRKARFSSEDERYVLQEQRARESDLSTNRTSEASAAPEKAREAQNTKNARLNPVSKNKLDFNPPSALARAQQDLKSSLGKGEMHGDLDVGMREGGDEREPSSEDGRPLVRSFGGVEKGVSTFGESTPDDVRFGDFTALNTDRNLYYTFYARMEEKIRNRWIGYARAAVYDSPVNLRMQTGKETWITKLEIILDSEGRFVKAIMHESSGVRSLDAAPVQAFRDAYQFPNPPTDLIKDDGKIHIYYAFNVYQ